jgi:phospholipid/cholesterol/gamma-HCH transport system substrate-binding protein
VYINATPAQTAQNLNITFKVRLFSGTVQMQTQSPVFSGLGPVEEFVSNGSFIYFAGNSSNYQEIEKLLTVAKRNFPDATIAAYRDGKEIRLEKALRILK